MTEDPRCCGSGTCLIDTEGRCWCGQQWDGEKMCFAPTSGEQPPPEPDGRDPATPLCARRTRADRHSAVEYRKCTPRP